MGRFVVRFILTGVKGRKTPTVGMDSPLIFKCELTRNYVEAHRRVPFQGIHRSTNVEGVKGPVEVGV